MCRTNRTRVKTTHGGFIFKFGIYIRNGTRSLSLESKSYLSLRKKDLQLVYYDSWYELFCPWLLRHGMCKSLLVCAYATALFRLLTLGKSLPSHHVWPCVLTIDLNIYICSFNQGFTGSTYKNYIYKNIFTTCTHHYFSSVLYVCSSLLYSYCHYHKNKVCMLT